MSIIRNTLAIATLAIGIYSLSFVSIDAAQQLKNVYVPQRMVNIKVYYGAGNFFVCKNGSMSRLNNYDVCPRLRHMMKDGCMPSGCIILSEVSDHGNYYYALSFMEDLKL